MAEQGDAGTTGVVVTEGTEGQEGTEGTILDSGAGTEGGEGNDASFASTLGEDYANDSNFTKFNDVESLAKSYRELSKTIGKDKVVLPTEGEEYDAQLKAVMNKLGTPEGIEGYTVEKADLSEFGIEDAMDIDGFKAMALEANMTDAQANTLYGWYASEMKGKLAANKNALQESHDAAETALRQEYGDAFPDSLAKANKVFDQHFPSLKKLDKSVGNDPEFIKDLVNISKIFSESSVGDLPSTSSNTPAEAAAERRTLMNSDAYLQPAHMEHAEAVIKARELLKQELAGQA